MTIEKAWSLLEVKAVDEDRRVVTGWATTPTPDRVSDVVEPEGMVLRGRVKLHLFHKHDQPVGTVTFGKPTKKGVPFEASIPDVKEEGTVRDRVNEALHSLKYKLLDAVSIGFRPLESEPIAGTYGTRFKSWEMLELSLVGVPANPEAVITAFKSCNSDAIRNALGIQITKSMDEQQMAANGQKSAQSVRFGPPPGASGKPSANSGQLPKPLEGNNMNVQDQLKRAREERQKKIDRQTALMEKSAETGETLSTEDSAEYDTVGGEIEALDTHIKRLEVLEKNMAAQTQNVTLPAKAADPVQTAKAQDTRTGQVQIALKEPAGYAFARFAGVVARSKGNMRDALDFARERFPNETPMHDVLKMFGGNDYETIRKAAVAVGTTVGTTWAAPLVQYQTMENEFIEWLRPQTIVGRIPGLRNVPFNIQVPRQTNGGTAGWVGEIQAKPVTALAFDMVTLRFTKLATIAVISQELARFSNPSAVGIIRDTLAGAIIQQMDSDFVNPANAGTPDVKPASITNGVTPVASAGSTPEDIDCDIGAVMAPWIAANLNPTGAVWLMSATTALALSLRRNPLTNARLYPDISMTGGTFAGLPVVVSEAVGNIIVLLNAPDILLADDGVVSIDSSSEASLQMDSAPDNPTTATTVLVSLWQRNLLGIRAEREVNWVKAREAAVQYISGVDYGACSS